ncbi:hypothetical protein A8990_12755 [Paenibacillus taihuensis]|uniref:Lipoprotein n=1 Tax=Paenibacillus taihuensis TaxID=1156355 RepID=A0A3D9RHQ7_9BACL|nr:hypothetical protein [Paenibacillus taihuensis]REE77735.1 hypothetical protein A8990_12755 [Paenibacillus taihuensis]
MKLKYLFGLSLGLAVVIFATSCSSAQEIQENQRNQEMKADRSVNSGLALNLKDASKAADEEKTAEVSALHLVIQIPSEWTLQSGEESFSFQKDEVPVGGLDGLGYNDSKSIDSLLPNGAIVNKKESLNGFPVPTVRAHLKIEASGNEGEREEIHYYYFLKESQVIYDLRFDAKQITLDDSEKIAKTAKAIH